MRKFLSRVGDAAEVVADVLTSKAMFDCASQLAYCLCMIAASLADNG